MLKNISAKGRKMVTIIDPHIKRDDSYSVYRDANAHDGYFVKNKDGGTYDGWCWPGMLSAVTCLSCLDFSAAFKPMSDKRQSRPTFVGVV